MELLCIWMMKNKALPLLAQDEAGDHELSLFSPGFKTKSEDKNRTGYKIVAQFKLAVDPIT